MKLAGLGKTDVFTSPPTPEQAPYGYTSTIGANGTVVYESLPPSGGSGGGASSGSPSTSGASTDVQGIIHDAGSSMPALAGSSTDPANVPLWLAPPKDPTSRWSQSNAKFTSDNSAVLAGMATANTATSKFMDLSASEVGAFKDLAVKAGLASKTSTSYELYGLWTQAVSMAQSYNATQRDPFQYLSPYQVLGRLASSQAAMGNASAGMSTTTTTQRQSFTEPELSGTITNILQKELGRDPTNAELSRYTKVVQAAYDASPVVNTRTRYATGDYMDVQSGGTDTQQAVTDAVKKSPEWGTYQGATTYFNTAMQALAAPA